MINIRKILQLPDLLDAKRVLCIQPHADDNEVGAGGTIKALRDRGAEVVFVTVTDGQAGSVEPDYSAHDLVIKRKIEKENAAKWLDVSLQYDLDFPDGHEYLIHDVAAEIVEILRSFRPEVVMTVDPWSPYEGHPDHLKTGHAVVKALLFSQNASVFPIKHHPFYSVPQVAFYASSYPNTYIDVTPHFLTKMAAIQEHASQFDNEDWPLLREYLIASAKELYLTKINQNHEEGYAEAFKVLSTRQLHYFPMAMYQ